MSQRKTLQLAIPAGESTSSSFAPVPGSVMGVFVPEDLTGECLVLEASLNNSHFGLLAEAPAAEARLNARDSFTMKSVNVGARTFSRESCDLLAPWPYVRFRSIDADSAPAAEDEARTITVVFWNP